MYAPQAPHFNMAVFLHHKIWASTQISPPKHLYYIEPKVYDHMNRDNMISKLCIPDDDHQNYRKIVGTRSDRAEK